MSTSHNADCVNLHVCAPPTVLRRMIRFCPTCKTRRRFSGFCAIWYGTTWTCCGCGDRWTDGEMHERPFARGWRAKAIADAKRDWDQAGNADEQASNMQALISADLAAMAEYAS